MKLVGDDVVVRHGHTEGDIPGYHEMVWMGDAVRRDKRGRPHKTPSTLWAQVVCNNPGCEAEVLVNARLIAKKAGA